jgi:hypothetical protein
LSGLTRRRGDTFPGRHHHDGLRFGLLNLLGSGLPDVLGGVKQVSTVGRRWTSCFRRTTPAGDEKLGMLRRLNHRHKARARKCAPRLSARARGAEPEPAFELDRRGPERAARARRRSVSGQDAVTRGGAGGPRRSRPRSDASARRSGRSDLSQGQIGVRSGDLLGRVVLCERVFIRASRRGLLFGRRARVVVRARRAANR